MLNCRGTSLGTSIGGFPITTSDKNLAESAASYRFALAAAEMAANTRAEDVVLLDLRERSPVTEFFILATGTSPRQMRTVAEEIQELGKRMNFRAWHTTGFESAKWILVDCVSVVAHIFDADSRDFYDLELLWGDCPRIDWRKELGLPPALETAGRVRTRINFGESAGLEDIDAEEEEARLEGNDEKEEGDADIDEDAELDAPIVMEFPDESTGSNSVEFVEVDPPSKRRKRGRAIYPTTIGDEDITEEERSLHAVGDLGGRSQSTDEDDRERTAEAKAADDVEGVSSEDLPRKKIRTRPMGGVSAGMASTRIVDTDEEDQLGDVETSARGQRDQRPGARATKPIKTVPRSKPAAKKTKPPGKAKRRRNQKDARGKKKAAPKAASRTAAAKKKSTKKAVAKTRTAKKKKAAPRKK